MPAGSLNRWSGALREWSLNLTVILDWEILFGFGTVGDWVSLAGVNVCCPKRERLFVIARFKLLSVGALS
jgi:hypothetical protein